MLTMMMIMRATVAHVLQLVTWIALPMTMVGVCVN